MSAPVRCIDEILSVPHSADDFRSQEVPPSDDDSWLYDGEDELNSALQEREKEMELYDSKHKRKQKLKESVGTGPSLSSNNDDNDLGNIAKSMQAFVQKVSSYQGAEIPENRLITMECFNSLEFLTYVFRLNFFYSLLFMCSRAFMDLKFKHNFLFIYKFLKFTKSSDQQKWLSPKRIDWQE